MQAPEQSPEQASVPTVVVNHAAPLGPRQIVVLFDVTNQCNIRCRMCHFSLKRASAQRPVSMTPEVFAGIAAKTLPYAQTCFLSASAESLTSPHFVEILRETARYRVPSLRLITNGQLLDERVARAMIDADLTLVDISVDGATRETYELIRRGASFEKLLRNLRLLEAIKKERRSKLPRVQFSVTLMRSNLDELPALVDLAESLGVESICCRHVVPYRGLKTQDESLALIPDRANAGLLRFLERVRSSRTVSVTHFPNLFGHLESEGGIAGNGVTPKLSKPRPPWWTPRFHLERLRRRRALHARTGGVPLVVPRSRPFGAIDEPPDRRITVASSLRLAGWAIGRRGVQRVSVWRQRIVEETKEPAGTDGWVEVGDAEFLTGLRPDVAQAYPEIRSNWRTGWWLEVNRPASMPRAAQAFRYEAIAHAPDGRRHSLGTRVVEYRGDLAEQPIPFCKKAFACIFIDHLGDVYPYPDCIGSEPFGSLTGETSLKEIWFGEQALELRRSILQHDPPAMCLDCPDFINRKVDERRYFDERCVDQGDQRTFGRIEAPRGRAGMD